MTPKEMIEAQAAEFDLLSGYAAKARARARLVGELENHGTVAYFTGKSEAYLHAAESLRKLLALKGWE